MQILKLLQAYIYDSPNQYAGFFAIVQNGISEEREVKKYEVIWDLDFGICNWKLFLKLFYFLQIFAGNNFVNFFSFLFSIVSSQISILNTNFSILTCLQQKLLINLLSQFPGVIFFQPFPVIFGAFTYAIGKLTNPGTYIIF